MRPKSMVLIVVALGCGLIASIGISQVMENGGEQEATPKVEKAKIYVATRDVEQGVLLTPQCVKLEEWPKNLIPDGAVRELTEIEGKKTKGRLFPGEPILLPKLVDKNDLNVESDNIPQGMRVVSVKVTVDSSASGLLNPGDRVDVLVYLRRGAGIPVTTTRTIMKNVSVFAVNAVTEREIDDDSSIRAKTVSLLVSPDQAERITLASELGRIKLSLRRGDDDTSGETPGATLSNLEGWENGSSNLSESANAGAGILGSFLGSMVDANVDTEVASNNDASSEVSPAPEVWSMEVISGAGDSSVYHWNDRDSLPLERLGDRPLERESADAPQGSPQGSPQGIDDWTPSTSLSGLEELLRAENELNDTMTDSDNTDTDSTLE